MNPSTLVSQVVLNSNKGFSLWHWSWGRTWKLWWYFIVDCVQNINHISKDGSIKGTTRVCGRQRTARCVSSCSPFTPTRERELLTSGSSHLSFGCWKSKRQFLALPQPHTKSRGDWWITKISHRQRLSKSCDCQSVRCDTFWAGWFPIVRFATISEKGPYKWVAQAGRPNFLLSHRNGQCEKSDKEFTATVSHSLMFLDELGQITSCHNLEFYLFQAVTFVYSLSPLLTCLDMQSSHHALVYFHLRKSVHDCCKTLT